MAYLEKIVLHCFTALFCLSIYYCIVTKKYPELSINIIMFLISLFLLSDKAKSFWD